MSALEAEGLLRREVEFLPSHRGDGRPPPLRARPRAPRARGAARLRQAQPDRGAAALRRSPTTRISSSDLRDYFPDAVVERLGHLLAEHPLRRELWPRSSPTAWSTRSGRRSSRASWPSRARRRPTVVRAYRIARDVTGADARWEAIEHLGGTARAGAVDAHGGRRRARRDHRALVPGERDGGRSRRDDHGRARGLRTPRGGPSAARRAGAPRGARARGAGARRGRRARGPRPLHAWLPRAGPRPRRDRGRRGRRTARSRTSGAPSRCSRTACRSRGSRTRLAEQPSEHADAALGLAGAARRLLARAPRPRRARAAPSRPGARPEEAVEAFIAARARGHRPPATSSRARWRSRAPTSRGSRSCCASCARWPR